jgi:hypothetical protein
LQQQKQLFAVWIRLLIWIEINYKILCMQHFNHYRSLAWVKIVLENNNYAAHWTIWKQFKFATNIPDILANYCWQAKNAWK